MKTPRDVLIESSASMSSKVDAIRVQAIREGLSTRAMVPDKPTRAHRFSAFVERWLEEWVRPYRFVWGTVAALWMSTLTLTVMTQPVTAAVVVAKQKTLPDVILAVLNHRKALAEAIVEDAPLPPPSPVIKPRTHLLPHDTMVDV